MIPYRRLGESVEVLLITSRRGRRWIFPKGVVERGESGATSAEREAFEEAGVRGSVDPSRLGSYRYEKWGGTCTVDVFPLLVEEVLDVWPESGSRRRQWFAIPDAVEALGRKELRAMLGALVTRIRR